MIWLVIACKLGLQELIVMKLTLFVLLIDNIQMLFLQAVTILWLMYGIEEL